VAHSDDGFLRGVTVDHLARIVADSDAAFWRAVAQHGWLDVRDDGVAVPAWDRHNGTLARKRAQTQARQTTHRQTQDVKGKGVGPSRSRNAVVTQQRDKCNAPVTQTSRSRNAGASLEERRGEERREEDNILTDVVCSEVEKPTSEPATSVVESIKQSPAEVSEIVLTFPTVGKVKEWHLRADRLAALADLYPGLDVLAEAKRARQWCEDNPTKRKTAKGCPAFLTKWLDRTNDRRAGRNPPTQPQPKPAQSLWDKLGDI
jgi:hypothetical protein